jgi:hypothetical protein
MALSINPGASKWKGPYLLKNMEAKELMQRFDYVCPGVEGAQFSLLPRRNPDTLNP